MAFHVTDVCPALALWTSMVVPEIDATSPLALPVCAGAAPAPLDIPRTTDMVSSAITATPGRLVQP